MPSRLFFFVGALAGAMVLLAPDATAAPSIDGAAIVRGRGRVRPVGSDTWTETSTGEVLGPGIRVESAADEPLEMTMPDGVEITLEPNTQAQWLEPSRLPTEKNTYTRGYVLTLREGELHVRVPSEPRGARAFLVTTSAGTLTAWRGSVHVAAKGDTTAVAIYEGALVVGSNGIGFPVYDGAGVVMRKGVNPERGKIIPAAPTWSPSARALQVAPAGERATVGLSWKEVLGGASYRVELATDPSMLRVIERKTVSGTSVDFSAPGAKYYARVRAVSAEGIVGAWSVPRPLRVVRPELPKGAAMASDGTILVPPDEASEGIAIGDPTGLEVGIDSTGRAAPSSLVFAAAPRFLRLGDLDARTFWLRDPSSGGLARLVVARRTLRTRLTASPKSPRWPDDAIDLSVSVFDPSGRTDPSTEALSVEATVNGSPVPVDWQRNGATWTGRLEPQVPPGPWVARVIVKDASGAEIGREILDIDGPKLPAKGVRTADTFEVRVYH